MRRFNFKFWLLLITILCFLLVSCDKKDTGGSSSSGGSNNVDNRIVLYTNSREVEFDNSTLKFGSSNLWLRSYSTGIYATFEIKNNTYSTKEYKVKDYVVTKEETNATYTTTTALFGNSFKLEAEMSTTLSFSADTPSTIKADKYRLDFTINNQTFTLYMYETPDELLPEWTIEYKINGKVVNTAKVRDNKELGSYVYDYPDHAHYCNLWKSGYTIVNSNTKVTTDMVLEGTQSDNIKWSTTATDAWSLVSGVNHVPADETLVIPSTNQGKEIAIGMYAIKGIEVKKIYLPKTIHIIYSGNFKGLGATIYYAGTEEEWKSLFYTPSEIITANVVYNTSYSG